MSETAGDAVSAPLDVDAVEARANAATPGPWDWDHSGVFTLNEGGMGGPVLDAHDPATPPHDGIGRVGDSYPRGINSPSESMEFIAHARTDVPALIAEVRRLRAALAPFAHFAEQWDAQPIRGLARADDQVIYGIHSGTPWMAELTAGDMRRARAALAPTPDAGGARG